MNKVRNTRKVTALFIVFSIISLLLSIGWIAAILNYSYVFRMVETANPATAGAQHAAPIIQTFNVSSLFPIAMESVVLYKANFNFVNESGTLEIKIEIGNSGASETRLTQLYVGASPTSLDSQTILPMAIPSGGTVEITLDYNWTGGETYYLKAMSSSGQTLNWSEQAPSPEATDDSSSQMQGVPFRVDPETVTVKAGETFSVDVVFEDMPANPGVVGFEFNITWDPSVLKAVSMDDVVWHSVTPESEWDNIWVIRNTVSQGSVLYAQTWQSFPRAQENGYFTPVSGNGTVARITFESLTAGTTKLHFETAKCAGLGSLDSVVKIILKTADSTVTVT